VNALRPQTAVFAPSSAGAESSSRLLLWIGCCLAITLLLSFASLLVGTSSLRSSLDWLASSDPQSQVVLWQIRLPRTVGAWFAGALLGLAGAIAQGVFRNPLAEPYLLGTASGAALGVTISLMAADASIGGLAWAGQLGLTGAASVGACAAIVLTIGLSRGMLQTSRLLLSGIVVGFLMSAVTALLLLTRPDTFRVMQAFLLGSTAFVGWSSSMLLAIVFFACIVPAILLSRGLDALTLGEETAESLGLSLPKLRLALLAIVSLATAAVVGQVGIVGFVGLVAPHLVRETIPVNHRQLLIAAPLAGGALLQAADLASRWILRPAELPVGAVTACVGGAYLVYLLWRRARDV
jgi:iron complex transport system permease protein